VGNGELNGPKEIDNGEKLRKKQVRSPENAREYDEKRNGRRFTEQSGGRNRPRGKRGSDASEDPLQGPAAGRKKI